MQTILAYAFAAPAAPGRVDEGLARVEAHYRPLWPASAVRRGRTADRLGLVIWDRADDPCRWPSWHDGAPDLAVATLHVPVAYEAVTGPVPPQDAPPSLACALLRDHDVLLDLTPPFVVASVGGDRLDLFVDAAGLGRLFELRTPEGWVWSNRPAAALLFAGRRGALDTRGWRYEAATAFFMHDASPVDGMTGLLGGTHVSYDATRARRTSHRLDALSAWAAAADAGDPLQPDRLDEVAEGLAAVARSVAALWPELPLIGLSGGRDSRMVAGAFLAGGIDVSFTTTDNFAEETEVARRLTSLLPGEVRHRIAAAPRPDPGKPPTLPAVERALQWHRLGEGFRPPSFLPSNPPARILVRDQPVISGAAGEMCHARYYPADLTAFDAPPRERLQRLTAHLVKLMTPYGISAATRETVTARVRDVVREARGDGIDDVRVLDCFYLMETMRRWGTAGEPGTVTPLLHPAFVRASLGLSTPQRLDDALPRALTARLVPAWADVPYFGPAGARVRRRQLHEEPDRDLITGVIAEPAAWRDAFDVDAVQRAWRDALDGGELRYEGILQRVVWRVTFADFLAEVAGSPIPPRAPATPAALLPPPPPAPAPRTVTTRLRRAPAVRRLRRTPLGAALAALLRHARG